MVSINCRVCVVSVKRVSMLDRIYTFVLYKVLGYSR